MLYYVTFLTALGWIGALSSSQGIVKTTFPLRSQELALESLNLETTKVVNSNRPFGDIIKFYAEYFSGHNIFFSGKFDFTNATAFQQIVWKATCHIPYGKTRSYRWIALNIDKPFSYRAVGNALNKNPLPIIIPCHRVINSNGQLGGYGGGIDIKKQLLNLEIHSCPF